MPRRLDPQFFSRSRNRRAPRNAAAPQHPCSARHHDFNAMARQKIDRFSIPRCGRTNSFMHPGKYPTRMTDFIPRGGLLTSPAMLPQETSGRQPEICRPFAKRRHKARQMPDDAVRFRHEVRTGKTCRPQEISQKFPVRSTDCDRRNRKGSALPSFARDIRARRHDDPRDGRFRRTAFGAGHAGGAFIKTIRQIAVHFQIAVEQPL